jgi:hypothetical protein
MDCSFGHGEFAVDVSQVSSSFNSRIEKKTISLLSTIDSNFFSFILLGSVVLEMIYTQSHILTKPPCLIAQSTPLYDCYDKTPFSGHQSGLSPMKKMHTL